MKIGTLCTLAASLCLAALGVYFGLDFLAPPLAPVPVTRTPAPDPPATPAATTSENPCIGVVAIKRLFDIHPKTKDSEAAINAKRNAAKQELERLRVSGDADGAERFRKTKEKELQDESDRLRGEIVADLRRRVSVAAAAHDLDFVLDTTGQSANGVPVVMHASGFIDLTDEIAQGLQRRAR
jgi:hypothetical protein